MFDLTQLGAWASDERRAGEHRASKAIASGRLRRSGFRRRETEEFACVVQYSRRKSESASERHVFSWRYSGGIGEAWVSRLVWWFPERQRSDGIAEGRGKPHACRRWVVRKRRSPHTNRFKLKAALTLTARTQRPPARRQASVHFGLHVEAISWRSATTLSRANSS
jgi:hypothetical protein